LVDPDGLAAKNEHPTKKMYVKKEGNEEAIEVTPDKPFNEKQDGVALPDVRPGEVLKTVDNIDVVQKADGTVEVKAVVPPELKAIEHHPESLAAFMNYTENGQATWGGWQDKAWVTEGKEKNMVLQALRGGEPHPDWEKLYEKSVPPNPKD
jgi:hypothetical protein